MGGGGFSGCSCSSSCSRCHQSCRVRRRTTRSTDCHDRRHPAMAEALRRAGPAIIASGSTVILALLALSAAELNSTKSLGPVLEIGVAVGMFSMLTLLPALMVTFPRGAFWPYRPSYGSAEPTYRGMWARIGWAIAPGPPLRFLVPWTTLAMARPGLPVHHRRRRARQPAARGPDPAHPQRDRRAGQRADQRPGERHPAPAAMVSLAQAPPAPRQNLPLPAAGQAAMNITKSGLEY